MTNDLLDVRHQVASAAGNIAGVAAQVSRALAWESSADQVPAFCNNLETALASLAAAQRQLHEAVALARRYRDKAE